MLQVFQDLRNGNLLVENVPMPTKAGKGQLLIETSVSLISTGTERMLTSFAKAGVVGKMKQQPDSKEVIEKAKVDGIVETLEAVKSKLDDLLPMGYCNVGTVIDVGEGIVGSRKVIGLSQMVIILVCIVPVNLCYNFPKTVKDDEAAFTVLGAISLQGIRLANPTLGETFVVSGLGLIGQLACQILKACGCNVIGVDPDKNKCDLAKSLGLETINLSPEIDPLEYCLARTNGIGVDGVVITASTSSSDPVTFAAKACRQRGRIILIGVTGLELRRDLFYKKELSFQVSCSYGPGRYDPKYEESGLDYPIGFVRWTEQRNFAAVVNLIASNRLILDRFISHRFSIKNAQDAFGLLEGSSNNMGILLDYTEGKEFNSSTKVAIKIPPSAPEKLSLNFVGAGNYADAI